ncbi:MAG TPA: phosphoglucomutase [Peptococcaceae bacterium]|nr:phosphoglucomutase [Peptococcaceae bacterium]
MINIKFGTDGWRSIIAEDFTFENVRAVAQAVADHIIAKGSKDRGVVIGYDNRFLSEHFAWAVAEVMTGNSISVYIPQRSVPTPITALAIKEMGTAGAIMITASHNPPEYNGIKYIADFAGPALPEETNAIENNLQRIIKTGEIKRMKRHNAEALGLWNEFDPFPAYKKHLKGLINVSVINKAGLKIVVDPLHGAGTGYLEAILEELGCDVVSIHNFRDPLFGGKIPDPVEKNLAELREQVLNTGADLGLALDGDGDRFGVIDKTGRYFTPNEVLFLLLNHLVKNREELGRTVARTVATTHMLDKVAERYGLEVRETPVGFKYIGQCILWDDSILGGEESGGMCIKGHVPEKDGILGSVLVAEAVAASSRTLGELQDKLFEEYGRMVSSRLDVPVSEDEKEIILEKLKNYNPNTIAGQKVVKKLEIDGSKFVNNDGSWVLIRPSGTEPMFRVYAEANNEEQLKNIQQQIREELNM